MAADGQHDALIARIDRALTRRAGDVNDPEIHRPITELGMVNGRIGRVEPGGVVTVAVYLTVPGCPLRDTITRGVTAAVRRVGGVARSGSSWT